MSFRNHKIIRPDQLPDNLRAAVILFQNCFDLPDNGMVFHHVGLNTVEICTNKVNPYLIARFVKQAPEIYFEIEPIAPRYVLFRLFIVPDGQNKEKHWITGEIKRFRGFVDKPISHIQEAYRYFVKRAEYKRRFEEKQDEQ